MLEVVVGAVSLLLLGERGAEVVPEVAAEGRDPGEPPAHPGRVRPQLLQRGDRLADQGHVVAVEVGDDAVEVVCDERAAGAARVLLVDAEPEAEHEVVDEQLRAAVEEVGERLRPLVRLEGVRLLDRHPGQLSAPAGELIAAAHVLLLGHEQLLAGRQPLVSRSHRVLRASGSSFVVCQPARYS